jgi:carbon storage regulator
MLVLSRKIGEEIVIAGNIRVFVLAVDGGKVRLGVEAPRTIPVDRREVYLQRASAAVGGGFSQQQMAAS